MTRASTANTDAPVVIQTYVHVITDDTGKIGNVNGTTIRSQIRLMNSDFSGRSSATAAKTRFTFKLLRITRTRNTTWHNLGPRGGSLEFMHALRVGGVNALNVYIADAQDVDGNKALGWAYYPTENTARGSTLYDGIVVSYYTLPGMGSTIFGKTAPHEVGHWLGLYHTVDPDGACNGDYDEVDDTPAQKGSGGCIIGSDSCPDQPGLDSVSNFMSFSNHCCRTDFTPGQAARMSATWNAYRAQ